MMVGQHEAERVGALLAIIEIITDHKKLERYPRSKILPRIRFRIPSFYTYSKIVMVVAPFIPAEGREADGDERTSRHPSA
jgi:hypothetical protein